MQLSTTANLLCNHPAFEQHAAQLQQDEEACSGLVRLLILTSYSVSMQQQDAVDEDEVDWTIAVEVAQALASAPLRPTAQALARAAASGDSDAADKLNRQLEVSAQLVQLVTKAGIAGDTQMHLAQIHLARHLGMAAWHSYTSARLQHAARPGNPQSGGRQELQQARFLLPLVPTVVQLLQTAHAKAAGQAGSAAGAAGAAGAPAAATTSAAAGSTLIRTQNMTAGMANTLDGLLHHLQLAALCEEPGNHSRASRGSAGRRSGAGSSSGAGGGSEASLEAWCDAACAALRALPTLGAARQRAAGTDAITLSKAAEQACAFAKDAAACALALPAAQRMPVPAAGAALGASQRSLWQLHTAATRLCHWLASGGLQQLPSLRALVPKLLLMEALPMVAAANLHAGYAEAMAPAHLRRSR